MHDIMHYVLTCKGDAANVQPLLKLLLLCSDKGELLELKQTARKFNAKEFERLVNRHMKRLYGGNYAHVP